MKKAMYWLTTYLIILGLATAYGFYVDAQQDNERCDTIEEAVTIGGESIIEAASNTNEPNPAAIENYRNIIERNLQELEC